MQIFNYLPTCQHWHYIGIEIHPTLAGLQAVPSCASPLRRCSRKGKSASEFSLAKSSHFFQEHGTIFISEFCLLCICSNVTVSEVSVCMKMLAGVQADFFFSFMTNMKKRKFLVLTESVNKNNCFRKLYFTKEIRKLLRAK